ncbi:hypothetical protein [Geminocystis sp. GBBB08]|uniref:hypothetical protein n=1 Tax=Geminocystis sp. GBBB08 TaxID=2604140 RepID=UPI0027E25606|nr:hypothetical protein [Geminocystis sp. GBBB08]MBL1209257.1 hypothetical protein [Geminocystis sp. GBBB08]
MNFKNKNLQEVSFKKIIFLFFGGFTIVSFAIVIVYSFSAVELNLINGGFALFITILSGLLSSIFGKRFIDAFVNTLEFSGF